MKRTSETGTQVVSPDDCRWRLPLPQGLWDRYRSPLEGRIDDALPDWQAGAEIRPNGTANTDAVAAAMGELLIDMLNNHPAPPVLFLPYDMSNSRRSLPVKLTNVQVEKKTLILDVQPLAPAERNDLLTAIRAPLQEPAPHSPVPNAIAEQ